MSSGSQKCYEMQSCHNIMRDIFCNNDCPRHKAFLACLLSYKGAHHNLQSRVIASENAACLPDAVILQEKSSSHPLNIY